MIEVVLDTTVLRNDPLRKASAMRALRRLAMNGKLRIHISDISRREFITSRQLDFDSAIADTQNRVKKLRDVCPDIAKCDQLQSIIEEIKAQRDGVAGEVERWLRETKTQVHPVMPEDGLAVLDSYFGGLPPFSRVKSRADIPDAFVYQAVLALKDKVTPLHVVSNDNNLREHIEKLGGLIVYTSAEEFVKAPPVTQVIQRTENLEWFTRFVTSSDGSASRHTIANSIEEQLAEHSVGGFSEESEAMIDGYGDVRDLEFDIDNIEDFGEGIIAIPFSAYSECLVGYFIPKWDYYGMDDKRRPVSVEDWNDHVLRADEEIDLRIEGSISIEIENGALDGEIRNIKDWAKILQDADIEVEIESVDVADSEACI